jgi:hypothetical protein
LLGVIASLALSKTNESKCEQCIAQLARSNRMSRQSCVKKGQAVAHTRHSSRAPVSGMRGCELREMSGAEESECAMRRNDESMANHVIKETADEQWRPRSRTGTANRCCRRHRLQEQASHSDVFSFLSFSSIARLASSS